VVRGRGRHGPPAAGARCGTGWFQNLRANQDLRLSAGQASAAVPATIITDPARVGEIVAEFRTKYGADRIPAYYPKTDVAVQADIG
jgi:hypothetical protein